MNDEPVRSRVDLHLRHDLVLDHPGHDAGEAVAGGLADGDRVRLHRPALVLEVPGKVCTVDELLAARRATRLELAARGEAADGVDADAEELGDLARLVRRRGHKSGC